MSRIQLQDPQVSRLQDAIAQRVGAQRFAVWFSNSAKLELKNDSLEIAVPNDFISDWIGQHFSSPIQEAAQEVLGCEMPLRFNVVPQLFDAASGDSSSHKGHASHHSTGSNSASHSSLPVRRSVADLAANLTGKSSAKSGDTRQADPHSSSISSANRAAVHNNHATAGMLESRGLMKPNVKSDSNKSDSHKPDSHKPDSLKQDSRKPGFGTIGPAISPSYGLDRGQSNHNSSDRNGAHSINHSQNHSSDHSMDSSGSTSIGSVSGKHRLKFDLASFVAGSSNQLALTCIDYVAQHPGTQYNPLFIHATGSLGKTHLLHGLCRRFAEFHPTGKWAYLTGEDFTNEFVGALRSNKVEAFRRKMRELDLLVLDDVHFLAGKRSTQEEFLHTFNALEATGKQVVLASDAHPKHVREFSESLVNRFVSGMVVRIDPPNFSTRVEILKRLAVRARLVMTDDVIDWIAKRVTQNVRELEGALTRVQALSRLDGRTPGIDTVRAALGDLDRQMSSPLKPESILASVCEFFGLDMKELMSGRRQRTISLARSVAMYLVRKNSRLSFPEIAGKLGKRNHSTVISACRRIEKAAAKNEKLLWESSTGERTDEAQELIQRLEEHARAMG